MSFVGGKLKLKGGDALGAKGGSKKKKSKSKKLSSGVAGDGTDDQKVTECTLYIIPYTLYSDPSIDA